MPNATIGGAQATDFENEADIIGDTLQGIRTSLKLLTQDFEIIVIDDGSTDATADAARAAGAAVISHPYNLGNGAAIKTGIRRARGELLITIDGDGQHDPADIPKLLDLSSRYDMVVGSRNRASDTAVYRDLANRLYNTLATYIAGRKIDDLTSGFRVIKTHIARQFIYLLPNTFSYPSTLTLSVVRAGYSLGYIPIRFSRRAGKGRSKIKPVNDGFRFLMIILRISVFYAPLKVFLPLSTLLFVLGVGYGAVRVWVWHLAYGQTSALLMSTAVLVFMMGLISEQIAQLRFDRSESNRNVDSV